MTTRPPAVAGLFYPGQPAALAAAVDALLAAVPAPAPPPPAFVAPHAGYVYSGSTAALAYAAVRARRDEIAHVVILGPTHRFGLPAIALPAADRFATPLGDVPVWADGAARVAGLPQVAVSAPAHAEEHSIEVHLPFLQRTLADFDVLPLAVGWVSDAAVAEVVEAVWNPADTLIVASSDLSHYLPYDEARRRDEATLRQLLDLAGPLDHDQACGATPVNGLMTAAGRGCLGPPGPADGPPASAPGLTPRLLGACNSGDTAGDRARVVGYAAVGFYPSADTAANQAAGADATAGRPAKAAGATRPPAGADR
ncbi:MAG: AmmeMemoRadiSam system protein B [Propionibacteriaceae bacterium]|jgi:AmmeMemoRadiSam system protein B|nr:AmmeMemoRadiSam system protein B [Propionibacteriaceae bacterium]